MPRVTLKDIAREAGVSVMTVSNVVNGNRGRVSPTTAAEVERIVALRGYVPNASAQSLAAGRTRLVGLLVPAGTDDDDLLVSPHDVSVMGAVETALRRRDHHLMLRGVADARDVLDSVQRWNLDGVVVMGFTDDALDDLALPDDLPTVVIDAYSPGVHGPAAPARTRTVRTDDHEGGRLAAEHLLALGHTDVVFCGPTLTASHVVEQRLAGFRSAFAAHDVAWSPASIVPSWTTYADGLSAGARIAHEHPTATAVFATADVLAAGLVRGLAQHGVDVPGRVSVVGFDDAEIAQQVTPALTTVRQDTRRKGVRAAELLLDLVDAGAGAGGDDRGDADLIGVELVVRASTAPPP
ncbi:LacI family DNA-binding transcriptional regulator [Luteimicrobium subarcticum]|uniref:LacI family transcriptional regulator n=1 Tax=Luteimicrobium subarcticum TaxID=620910 RepID=A0A2M8W1S9_9MICO|nr:LacI family DNA-binding transcriptional regulator [Luteimicrobium subarcticum]PJI84875.1 LacI family transcriptional regulator [Luteimicrobium subarcticum]